MTTLDADVEIVEAPTRLSRLLGLLPDGRSYLATWLTLRVTIRETVGEDGQVKPLSRPKVEHRQERILLVQEPDGSLHPYGPLGDQIPPEWDVKLGYQPPGELLLSASAFKRTLDPDDSFPLDVAQLFADVRSVFDTFLDFGRDRDTADLLAVATMATWISDAFHAFPYLYPNGEGGSGKTKLINLYARLGYLGQVITAGGSFAALRDLAEYGATLCFDDAENLDAKTADPDKRALLLAGNRRGAFVPVKEPDGARGWKIRNVSAYCPKAFSAIRLPDPVLGRRSIVIPMVRSADAARANRDPWEDHHWPTPPRALLDQLWLFGLRHLPRARAEYEDLQSSDLLGAGFEPWRPLIATAHVIEAYGVHGLAQRLTGLARRYQAQRQDVETSDTTRLTVRALAEIADVLTFTDGSDVSPETPSALAQNVSFTAQQVADRVNRLAEEEELTEPDAPYTNARKLGRVLDRLRLPKSRAGDKRGSKLRTIARLDALNLLRAYGLTFRTAPEGPQFKTSETYDNVRTSDACIVCGEPASVYLTGLDPHCRTCYAAIWAPTPAPAPETTAPASPRSHLRLIDAPAAYTTGGTS